MTTSRSTDRCFGGMQIYTAASFDHLGSLISLTLRKQKRSHWNFKIPLGMRANFSAFEEASGTHHFQCYRSTRPVYFNGDISNSGKSLM